MDLDKNVQLVETTENDIRQIMNWFNDEVSLLKWSGSNFRYPFTPSTFIQDLKLAELNSFTLKTEDNKIVAFGQFYQRLNRCHLGRLVVAPNMRGKGIARILLEQLSTKGIAKLNLAQLSLFVLKDNISAIKAYQKFGFVLSEYPGDIGLPDCLYMIKAC